MEAAHLQSDLGTSVLHSSSYQNWIWLVVSTRVSTHLNNISRWVQSSQVKVEYKKHTIQTPPPRDDDQGPEDSVSIVLSNFCWTDKLVGMGLKLKYESSVEPEAARGSQLSPAVSSRRSTEKDLQARGSHPQKTSAGTSCPMWTSQEMNEFSLRLLAWLLSSLSGYWQLFSL